MDVELDTLETLTCVRAEGISVVPVDVIDVTGNKEVAGCTDEAEEPPVWLEACPWTADADKATVTGQIVVDTAMVEVTTTVDSVGQ